MSKNWPTKNLGDPTIMKMTSGGTPFKAHPDYYGGDIKWLGSGELDDNQNISHSEKTITQLGLKNSSAKIFPEGTVLIAMYGATAGKLGILAVEATTNQAVAGIICNEYYLHNKYLYYVLLNLRSDIISKAWGGAQPNLSQTILKSVKIPLPSVEEQKNIVKALEEKLSIIKTAIKFREDVITDSSKIIRSRLSEIFAGNRTIYPVVNFGNLAELVRGPFGGSLTKAMFVDSGYAVYEQGNVIKDEVSNFRYFITAEKFDEMKRFAVKEGDILMSCSGTIGKFTYIKNGFKNGIINQALLKITPDNTKISRPYLQLALTDYIANSTGHIKGAAIKNIMSVKDLKQILVPLPDLKTQENIVNEIDKFSEQVATLLAYQKSQLADFKALEQAYLKEALNGELSA